MPISYVVPVSGGDINKCYQVVAGGAHYFLKVNDANALPHVFVHEREGLRLLSTANQLVSEDKAPLAGVFVPQCYIAGQYGNDAYLLMEWLNRGERTTASMEHLGRALATIHHVKDDLYGLDYDNYFGSSKQSNARHDKWSDFFIEERLAPQVKKAYENGLIDGQTVDGFSALFNKMEDLYPDEGASLVHGDFWGGNYMVCEQEIPYFIDPAVYYGHREVDLAMSRLFGGFSDEFYDSYHAHYPLQMGWKGRLDLWNLYPLLFHLIAFGPSYRGQIISALKKYL